MNLPPVTTIDSDDALTLALFLTDYFEEFAANVGIEEAERLIMKLNGDDAEGHRAEAAE